MTETDIAAFVDVQHYPGDFLRSGEDGVHVAATYRDRWDDGFGARGWKLNVAIGDPAIIASTRETGDRIATSVFVHDVLDHLLSGFGISGHRSEAMALMQLAGRTGSDPRPDFEQMVREDLTEGRVNGESLMTFLPEQLRALLPAHRSMSDRAVIGFLAEQLGELRLFEVLVERFFALGREGDGHAKVSWLRLGLDYSRRNVIGLALQRALARADRAAEAAGARTLAATVVVDNQCCGMCVQGAVFGGGSCFGEVV